MSTTSIAAPTSDIHTKHARNSLGRVCQRRRIRFSCPACSARLSASKSFAGTLHHCPSCKLPVEVPRCGSSNSRGNQLDGDDVRDREPTSLGTSKQSAEHFCAFACKQCHGLKQCSVAKRGRKVRCASCGTKNSVPSRNDLPLRRSLDDRLRDFIKGASIDP